MPNRLVVLCGGIAFAFLSDDMQHFRSAVVLDLTQDAHQTYDVMSVGRTEIADVQAREDITFCLLSAAFQLLFRRKMRCFFSSFIRCNFTAA